MTSGPGDGDNTEPNGAPKDDATDDRLMDNIFRPDGGQSPYYPAASVDGELPEGEPVTDLADPTTEEMNVEAEVLEEESEPEPMWKRTWFIAVLALLIGLGIGAWVWGVSVYDAVVEDPPPVNATPENAEPVQPGATVTETKKVESTATAKVTETETKRVESTATETKKIKSTATETVKVKTTATKTKKVEATATETVKVEIPVKPPPAATVTITKPASQQNSGGLTEAEATRACVTTAKTKLTAYYPDSTVNVPEATALAASLRSDIDAWYVKVLASVDDSDLEVECYVSGSNAAPVVDNIYWL